MRREIHRPYTLYETVMSRRKMTAIAANCMEGDYEGKLSVVGCRLSGERGRECSLPGLAARPVPPTTDNRQPTTAHVLVNPAPLACSTFDVLLLSRNKFFRPNSDSSVSCQNGAPRLSSAAITSQPMTCHGRIGGKIGFHPSHLMSSGSMPRAG